ncbi:MAG: hypothetical protein CMJ78_04455 [Planctomycetaceae bacterium]|nr:hypothetical protein [Planctomycetaceae bacterium]
MHALRVTCLILATFCSLQLASADDLSVFPTQVNLHGARSRARIVAHQQRDQNTVADVTRQVTFEVKPEGVVSVDSAGVVSARGNGTTTILARIGSSVAQTRVTVADFEVRPPIDFRREVIGALSVGGCNQGACHGSPQGKNGFRLSLRGFKPDLDHMTLTREIFGRRTNPADPAESLILRKATNKVPHQGGHRYRETDDTYQIIVDWLSEGAKNSEVSPKLVRLELWPQPKKTLHTDSDEHQMFTLAHFDDGSVKDVSHLTVFTVSDEDAASVDGSGLVSFHQTAEVAVLARYLDELATVNLTYVRHDPLFASREIPKGNIVDTAVFAKHNQLQLRGAAVIDDAEFLRRVYLDVIGTLPTPEEAGQFLDSDDPNRRSKLVDQLLARPEFGSFWALKWADVMRGNRESISQRGVHVLHRYLVRHFREDRSFEQFAREILTSVGNTIHNAPANFYRISRTPPEAAESMAQLFLGVRIQCAKCHNHPFEAITQNDYYGLAATFARVRLKGRRFGNDDEIVYVATSGEVKHPDTEETIAPAAFGTSLTETDEADRRALLASWLTGKGQRYFATSTVNRVWFHLFGRGIVEPVDDFRESNPPAIPELLDTLAKQFVDDGYRIKPIIRTIVNSKTYQFSSSPAEQSEHAADAEKYFTSTKVKMLSAEQIIDGISAATGVPETFPGYPIGTRAIELAEGNIDHHFLKAFSKPVRDVACDCAREDEPSLNHVLHVMNNPEVLSKLESPKCRIAVLLAAKKSNAEIIETLYLASICRRPSTRESDLALKHVETSKSRSEGLQDLLHALVNSNEFLLRH